jgi:asparagine synthase (glutamine-hydrolysing)
MCGIIGYIINQKSEKKDFYKKKFFSNFHRQNHRGPDFKQEVNFNYKELKIQLGFNRLSIIDLEKSANKIFYNDQYYLLFNGEIYNFKKLKEDYLSNEKFSTKTDTEVLFKLLIKYGIDFLKKLEGIFAFTFLDIKKNKLYLARDFTGTKPLYFFKNNDGIFFSSEAWFQYSISDKIIDPESFNYYLKFGFSPINTTLIQDVKKIESGTYSIYDLKDKSLNTKKYFELNKSEDIKLKNYNLKSSFEDIVEKNLISDTKTGIFASGGIDSTLLLMIAKKFNSKVEAYSSYFYPENRFEKFNIDLKYTKKICEFLGIKLNLSEINLNNKKQKFQLINAFQKLDEPLPNLNFFNSFMQSKNAKSNNCKVILTGDGGDEIFGGYQRYRNAFIAKKIKYLSFFNKKIKLINTLKEEKILEYFYTKIDINHNINLFKKELKINKIKNHVKLPNWCSVEILNYFDTKHWLPEESNFKLDRSTMLNSIEGRVPFQDINLLKNIYPIYYKKKFNIFYDKKIIRNSFNKIPDFVLNRKKHGWFFPSNYYLKNNLKDFFLETFNKSKLDQQNIFNYASIIRLLNDHISGTKDYKSELITLLAFQSWYNQVLKT